MLADSINIARRVSGEITNASKFWKATRPMFFALPRSPTEISLPDLETGLSRDGPTERKSRHTLAIRTESAPFAKFQGSDLSRHQMIGIYYIFLYSSSSSPATFSVFSLTNILQYPSALDFIGRCYTRISWTLESGLLRLCSWRRRVCIRRRR